MIISSRFPPVPEGFHARFTDPSPNGGWRGVERAYGARREVLQRWIAACGGLTKLQEERQANRAAMKGVKA